MMPAMVMMGTVRRRVVCTLLVLALLCCRFSVGALPPVHAMRNDVRHSPDAQKVIMALEVSCADSDNKVKWRVSNKHSWSMCTTPLNSVDYSVELCSADGMKEPVIMGVTYGGVNDFDRFLCLSARLLYKTAMCEKTCGSLNPNETAFTMYYPTKFNDGLYTEWKVTEAAASFTPPKNGEVGKSGICNLLDFGEVETGDVPGINIGHKFGRQGTTPDSSPQAPTPMAESEMKSGVNGSGTHFSGGSWDLSGDVGSTVNGEPPSRELNGNWSGAQEIRYVETLPLSPGNGTQQAGNSKDTQ